MRFIFDYEGNAIFEGSTNEVKKMYIFVNEYNQELKDGEDKHLMGLLKDVNIKEKK